MCCVDYDTFYVCWNACFMVTLVMSSTSKISLFTYKVYPPKPNL